MKETDEQLRQKNFSYNELSERFEKTTNVGSWIVNVILGTFLR